MTRDELIEMMARAIWECTDDEVGWEATLSLARTGDAYMNGQVDFVRSQATAALTAIEAAGYAVAPKQATTAPLDLFGEPIRESVAAGPAANVEETIARLDAAITRLDVLLDRLSDELRESRVR